MTNPTSRLKPFERDFFVARITCGYIPVLAQWRVYPTTDEVSYESCEVFNKAYNQAERLGIYTDEDMPIVLEAVEQWSPALTTELEKTVVEDIDNFKVACYENIGNPENLKECRRCLKIAKDHQRKLFMQRHQYDYATCEGLATVAKWEYIVLNSVRDKKKKLVELPDDGGLIANILGEYQSKGVSDTIVRELAHNEPWSGIWSTSGKNIKMFRIRATDEQRRLIGWSKFYDNIHKSHECPHDNVIEDDDMLDGWVIKQRRDRDKEKAKSDDEKLLGKAGECDEVFVPIDAVREAHKQKTGEILDDRTIYQRIESFNNQHALNAKASRQALVNQKGEVKQTEFADVQIQMLNQLAGKR